jgi:hypothetical protein
MEVCRVVEISFKAVAPPRVNPEGMTEETLKVK